MVNEFAYCPRLFFYEWVEGLFEESSDTVEGAIQHRRVDAKATALPEAADLPGRSSPIHSRSVTLANERLRVIAKMDLVEAEGGTVTPVDYKHGRPREGAERIGTVAVGPGAACGAGDGAAGKRVPVRGGNRLLPQDRAAGPGGVRRRTDGGDGRDDSTGVEHRRGARDSAAAGGFAEVSGVLAGGDLPAGRDPGVGGGGAGSGTGAARVVRNRRGANR